MGSSVQRRGSVACRCGNEHLTEREVVVLCLVAAGNSTVQISACLHLSSHTVDRYLLTMLRRSGARNRAGLVARAYHAGVLRADAWPPVQTGIRCLPG